MRTVSGTLLTQIQEGYECDIFFSAAQKQMDDLEADGLVKDGTRANVVNNQVVVVTLKDSGTKVTGLETLKDAESIALAAAVCRWDAIPEKRSKALACWTDQNRQRIHYGRGVCSAWRRGDQ